MSNTNLHLSNRIFALDLLRSIAIFMVVLNHVIDRFFYTAPISTFTWFVAVAYFAFHNGTSLFFMVTGVAYLRPGREILTLPFLAQRLKRVILPSLFWILIYALYKPWVNHEHVEVIGVITNIINGPVYYHLWYIYALIPIYLIIPILSSIINKQSKIEIEYILILWFIGFSISPLISNIFLNVEPSFLITIFANFTGFLILGSYFYWINPMKHIGNIPIIYLVLFLLGILTTYILRHVTGKIEDFMLVRESPLMIGMSICIFIFFSQMNYDHILLVYPWFNKLIHSIAESSFAVYVLHIIFIELVPKYSNLWLGFTFDGKLFGHPVIGAPIFTILTISILVVVSQLFRKVPIVNYLLKVGGN